MTSTNSTYHTPVMLQESIGGLALTPSGVVVDATFGGGGHSKEILKHLPDGHLYSFDQDADAQVQSKAIDNPAFTFIKANFSALAKYMRFYNAAPIDGILADLGISSHQINQGERGFSFRFEATLDMRMNRQGGTSARELINEYGLQELTNVFREYGELKNAWQIANAIERARNFEPIESTNQLKEILTPLARRGREHKFFAQVFQAIRIEVNKEMDVLKELLLQSAKVLKKGGRLVVITYHSLEDRLVKNYIKNGLFSGEPEKDIYGNVDKPFKAITRKPMVPTALEIETNNRARSAKLRIAEKI